MIPRFCISCENDVYRRCMEVTMKEKLQKIKEEALRQIRESKDLAKLNDVRVAI